MTLVAKIKLLKSHKEKFNVLYVIWNCETGSQVCKNSWKQAVKLKWDTCFFYAKRH